MADKRLDVFVKQYLQIPRRYDVWIDDALLDQLRDIDGVEAVYGNGVKRFVIIDPRYNEAEVVKEIEAIGTCGSLGELMTDVPEDQHS